MSIDSPNFLELAMELSRKQSKLIIDSEVDAAFVIGSYILVTTVGHLKLKEIVVDKIWKKLVNILEITERELSPFFLRLKKIRTQISKKNPKQKAASRIAFTTGFGHFEHSSLPPLAKCSPSTSVHS